MKNNKEQFYAHSGNKGDRSDWQPLTDHLTNVGTLSKQNAAVFGAGDMAYVTGLLHDLGKYSHAFQERLAGSPQRVDHATAGAKIAIEHWCRMGRLIAFAIAGHHAGLANGIDEGMSRSTLNSRMALSFGKDIPNLDPIWQSQITLPKTITPPTLKAVNEVAGFQFAFFIRMLFSTLVDADYVDTDNFYRQLQGEPKRTLCLPNLPALREKFDQHLIHLQEQAARPLSPLNVLRNEILYHARKRAQQRCGIFSLTVPTGGGKTLTSMAFALDHAIHHQKRRIIYVIPFTSIIEQNARVFRNAFQDLGELAVLEHHSAFEEGKFTSQNSQDKLRLAMENWDAPIVVTTAVQFFESLFADRSSQCRKLHNIAGSVIVLDEAQTLPIRLLRPVIESIKELARNYGCSVVLCTATQPALKTENGFYQGFDDVLEIAPNPERLYQQLQRVQVAHIGEQTDEALIKQLTEHPQVLMIVNNRRHARSLFEGIKNLDGAHHLTTLMCAKHRSQVLDEIRTDLSKGKPCRVISTSLIEAGVDIDFPCVFRAETGLDSIAQAAGRCNREGKHAKEESHVYVFQTNQEQWKAPPELAQLAGNMREVVRNHAGDLLSPAAITLYFQHVYWSKATEMDGKNIVSLCNAHARELTFPFQNIARDFKMIDSHQMPVIIPFDDIAEKLIESLRFAEKVGGIARKLQPYVIQIPQKGFEELQKYGRIELIAPEKFGNQFWALIGKDLYDEQSGLSWDNPTFIKASG